MKYKAYEFRQYRVAFMRTNQLSQIQFIKYGL
jgi:hypothetical protein